MSRNRRRSRRNGGAGGRFGGGEDVNPMNYISNLSDAMLILAVGIMLALIIHWNVDVSTSGGSMTNEGMSLSDGSGGDSQVDTEGAIQFDEENMEQMEESEELAQGGGMDKLGEVYYDEKTGTYYVIKPKE